MSREIAELNLISEFNKLDLNNQPFSNWLSSHPPTPHNLHTHLTEEEVDSLIQRLKRNHESYVKWVEKKEGEEARLTAEKERQKLETRKAQAKAEREEQARKEKTKTSMEKWTKAKEEREIRQKALALVEKIQLSQERERQKKKAEAAFAAWMSKSKETCTTIKLPKKGWVPAVENFKHLVTTKPEAVSPPSLYNDYDLYQKHCPEFIEKYPLLVSRAGMEKAPDQRLPLTKKETRQNSSKKISTKASKETKKSK